MHATANQYCSLPLVVFSLISNGDHGYVYSRETLAYILLFRNEVQIIFRSFLNLFDPSQEVCQHCVGIWNSISEVYFRVETVYCEVKGKLVVGPPINFNKWIYFDGWF